MTKRYPLNASLTVSKVNRAYRRGFYDAIRTVISQLSDRDKGRYAELLRGLLSTNPTDYKKNKSL